MSGRRKRTAEAQQCNPHALGEPMKPTLLMIGADKGGIGKTTMARALLDFFAQNNVVARAFDTEHPHGILDRFHGPQTQVVDITQTADQMRVLDTLTTDQVKVTVVDARAGALTSSLVALRDVGFFDMVRAGECNFVLMHVLGPSISSLDEIAAVAPFVADADYFLVRNYINDTTFFDWDPATYQAYFGKARMSGEVTITKLNTMAYEQVDIAGSPFSTFVANKTSHGEPANHSFVLRGYVRTWLAKNAQEFHRIRLLEKVGNRT